MTLDFAKTPEQRQILELVYSQMVFARPFMVAAEVPKERVEALRNAFRETWADPDLLAETKKMNLDVAPISGADIQTLIAGDFINRRRYRSSRKPRKHSFRDHKIRKAPLKLCAKVRPRADTAPILRP